MKLKDFDRLVGQDSYVRCVGKERVDPSIVSAKSASRHVMSGGTIGWWVRSGYIVVDIDEGREEAINIIRRLGLRTLMCKTPKGLHLYFKTMKDFPQKVGMIMPFGLKADFRCANKGYVLLPFGASGRALSKCTDIIDLPLEFTPMPTRKDSLLGLKDGQGRNATLFSHLMAYKHRGADEEQIETMAFAINEEIFDDPMPDEEIEKILSNVKKYEANLEGDNPYLIYNTKGKASGINNRAINDYFVNRGDVFVMAGECYQYQDGVYHEASNFVRSTIKDMIGVDHLISQTRIMETYRLLTDDIRILKQSHELNANDSLINFANGVYNIHTGQMLEHDSKYLQTLQIPHNCIPPTNEWEDTMLYSYLSDVCGLDDENIDMIADYMAYMLTLSYGLKTFMVLLGPSNTGKSVLIRFIEHMVGHANTSALSIHELNQRFYPAQLYNRLLNACADNSALPLSAIENLKKITGGDKIMHERKGKEPFFFTPFCKLIFSFNQMPLQLEEKSNAFYLRMRVLNMNNPIVLDDKYVNTLCSQDTIEEVIPHLLARLPLTMIPRTFESDAAIENLRRDSDSVHAFLTSHTKKAPNCIYTKESLYEAYVRWCISHGREAHKKHTFTRHMRSAGYKETRDPRTREAAWKGLRAKKKPGNRRG